MLCEIKAVVANDGCHQVVCQRCGYSSDCARKLPFKRLCGAIFQPESFERVGTHLKLLLLFFGIKAGNCKCNTRARYLNSVGADWCEQNIETIVEWLKEEAAARGLPFISTVGRMIVRRAISNARKEAQRAKADT